MPLVYTYNGETDYTDGVTSSGFQPENFAYGGRITFSQSGTINQLGLYVGEDDTAAVTIKIALYDTSGNLVVDGGTISVPQNTAEQWFDTTTFTATSVSATDYVILYSASGSSAVYGYDTSNDGSFATEGHATFPADPETITLEGDTGQGYGGRANFTAGGGSTVSDVNFNATNRGILRGTGRGSR